MALQPCPECSKQISSRARFCPNCGYPFEHEPADRNGPSTEVVTKVRRPLGIVLGISMCVLGILLLGSRFLLMLPFYARFGSVESLSRRYWQTEPVLQFVLASPVWFIFGFGLLAFGIIQLFFGSTKLTVRNSYV
jgi:hypothetical protein